jgi:hypothetical protein
VWRETFDFCALILNVSPQKKPLKRSPSKEAPLSAAMQNNQCYRIMLGVSLIFVQMEQG